MTSLGNRSVAFTSEDSGRARGALERLQEEKVNHIMKKHKTQNGTPRKRAVQVDMVLASLKKTVDDLTAEVATMEAEKEGLSGNPRGVKTRQINGKKKALSDAKDRLAEYVQSKGAGN
ncbi:hypothetical protein ACJBU6_11267 [Exserohilum turcicum]